MGMYSNFRDMLALGSIDGIPEDHTEFTITCGKHCSIWAGDGSIFINWGDGAVDSYEAPENGSSYSHEYAKPGIHTICVWGTHTEFRVSDPTNSQLESYTYTRYNEDTESGQHVSKITKLKSDLVNIDKCFWGALLVEPIPNSFQFPSTLVSANYAFGCIDTIYGGLFLSGKQLPDTLLGCTKMFAMSGKINVTGLFSNWTACSGRNVFRMFHNNWNSDNLIGEVGTFDALQKATFLYEDQTHYQDCFLGNNGLIDYGKIYPRWGGGKVMLAVTDDCQNEQLYIRDQLNGGAASGNWILSSDKGSASYTNMEVVRSNVYTNYGYDDITYDITLYIYGTLDDQFHRGGFTPIWESVTTLWAKDGGLAWGVDGPASMTFSPNFNKTTNNWLYSYLHPDAVTGVPVMATQAEWHVFIGEPVNDSSYSGVIIIRNPWSEVTANVNIINTAVEHGGGGAEGAGGARVREYEDQGVTKYEVIVNAPYAWYLPDAGHITGSGSYFTRVYTMTQNPVFGTPVFNSSTVNKDVDPQYVDGQYDENATLTYGIQQLKIGDVTRAEANMYLAFLNNKAGKWRQVTDPDDPFGETSYEKTNDPLVTESNDKVIWKRDETRLFGNMRSLYTNKVFNVRYQKEEYAYYSLTQLSSASSIPAFKYTDIKDCAINQPWSDLGFVGGLEDTTLTPLPPSNQKFTKNTDVKVVTPTLKRNPIEIDMLECRTEGYFALNSAKPGGINITEHVIVLDGKQNSPTGEYTIDYKERYPQYADYEKVAGPYWLSTYSGQNSEVAKTFPYSYMVNDAVNAADFSNDNVTVKEVAGTSPKIYSIVGTNYYYYKLDRLNIAQGEYSTNYRVGGMLAVTADEVVSVPVRKYEDSQVLYESERKFVDDKPDVVMVIAPSDEGGIPESSYKLTVTMNGNPVELIYVPDSYTRDEYYPFATVAEARKFRYWENSSYSVYRFKTREGITTLGETWFVGGGLPSGSSVYTYMIPSWSGYLTEVIDVAVSSIDIQEGHLKGYSLITASEIKDYRSASAGVVIKDTSGAGNDLPVVTS